MSNTKKKNNARTGGAVTSPTQGVEFINTGHAAQARYLAALANPFASPAVPIPDSFLEAHVSKIGLEEVITAANEIQVNFYKTVDAAAGNYVVEFLTREGGVITSYKSTASSVGTRIVAAGIAFEDVGQLDSIEGVITYEQENLAYDGAGSSSEAISKVVRKERNKGHGTVLYEPMTRQSLDFEGASNTTMRILFSTPRNVIARWSMIVETDGVQGLTEINTNNKNFVITSSYPNHHAGIFADTPMPYLNHALIDPSHTDVADHNPGHHSTAVAAAAHWVASAAGWAWRHKDAVANVLKRAPEYYQALTSYGGSVMSSVGQITALGARAAPLAIAM